MHGWLRQEGEKSPGLRVAVGVGKIKGTGSPLNGYPFDEKSRSSLAKIR